MSACNKKKQNSGERWKGCFQSLQSKMNSFVSAINRAAIESQCGKSCIAAVVRRKRWLLQNETSIRYTKNWMRYKNIWSNQTKSSSAPINLIWWTWRMSEEFRPDRLCCTMGKHYQSATSEKNRWTNSKRYPQILIDKKSKTRYALHTITDR